MFDSRKTLCHCQFILTRCFFSPIFDANVGAQLAPRGILPCDRAKTQTAHMWKQVAARFVHAHAHLHHQHHHDHTSKSIFGSAPVFFGKLAADGSVAEEAPAPLMAVHCPSWLARSGLPTLLGPVVDMLGQGDAFWASSVETFYSREQKLEEARRYRGRATCFRFHYVTPGKGDMVADDRARAFQDPTLLWWDETAHFSVASELYAAQIQRLDSSGPCMRHFEAASARSHFFWNRTPPLSLRSVRIGATPCTQWMRLRTESWTI